MQVLKRPTQSMFTMVTLIVAGILLVACGPAAPTDNTTALPTSAVVEEPAAELVTSTPPPVGESAYPGPQDGTVLSPYPAGGQAALPPPTPLPDNYPASAGEETFLEPRFRIDLPGLVAGSTLIEGQAPPGIALALLDVSYNGVLLGTGRSDENGRFSIAVSPELIVGNRIGVTVAELEDGQTSNQMAEVYFPYRGEGFMNIPNVGILFDSALVQP